MLARICLKAFVVLLSLGGVAGNANAQNPASPSAASILSAVRDCSMAMTSFGVDQERLKGRGWRENPRTAPMLAKFNMRALTKGAIKITTWTDPRNKSCQIAASPVSSAGYDEVRNGIPLTGEAALVKEGTNFVMWRWMTGYNLSMMQKVDEQSSIREIILVISPKI